MVVRPSAVAGQFYPRDADRLRKQVSDLLANIAMPIKNIPKALIVPHAGYVYSGATAAAAFATLRDGAQTIRRVVLIGPAHYVHVRGIAAPTVDAFETPLGRVPVDKSALNAIAGLRLDAATAAAIEHGDWASLGPHQACGSRAVAGLLLETGRRDLKIRRLSLCNSGDTAGARDRVVGYGAWMFA
jgi:predicted class III extradiol MEMO1 family dioxygenase